MPSVDTRSASALDCDDCSPDKRGLCEPGEHDRTGYGEHEPNPGDRDKPGPGAVAEERQSDGRWDDGLNHEGESRGSCHRSALQGGGEQEGCQQAVTDDGPGQRLVDEPPEWMR